MATAPAPIPGTTLFDGEQAQKGYALNKMCFSFNSADQRQAFKADEEAYMRSFEEDAPSFYRPEGNISLRERLDAAWRAFRKPRP